MNYVIFKNAEISKTPHFSQRTILCERKEIFFEILKN
jgi:hypothetical protein